ncbi:MAG TPA: hypothetical protein VMC84_12365 [Methanocella sp.]|uniref:hypothetical protein n=1 Tax=Methanocella sp. TaxID=2052833 RepID=UPI002C58AACB|nr:hypothetical protein [Methanocella sp.]HTY91961.1 hypothetical protein [Methanocella sp.]
MRDISTLLYNAIMYVAGNEGIAKFNKAGYGSSIGKLVHPDGSLDLPRLMNTMLDVFPEEQASAIVDNVLAKYVETAAEEKNKPQASVGAPEEIGLSYEDNLATYLETESSDVQDLINEARMIRMAMGKKAPPKATNGGTMLHEEKVAVETPKPATAQEQSLPDAPRVSIVNPIVQEPVHALQAPDPPAVAPAQSSVSTPAFEEKVPRINIDRFTANTRPSIPLPTGGELSQDVLEKEIGAFIGARKAYSSVDIMDFIRYLKDKGYHFQENSVLESVYTWVEERKSRERAALLADIQSFLDRMPWPTESEVSAYIDHKKSEGIMCESSEIKRMILVEMIRKH